MMPPTYSVSSDLGHIVTSQANPVVALTERQWTVSMESHQQGV